MILNILSHSFLAYGVSAGKFTHILIAVSLYVTIHFYVAALSFLSIQLLTMILMCLNVDLFVCFLT